MERLLTNTITRVINILSKLPLSYLTRIGYFVGVLIYILDYRHRRIVRRNLSFALPGKNSFFSLRMMSIKTFAHMGASFIEPIKLMGISKEEIKKYFQLDSSTLELLQNICSPPYGVIMITAHIGAWEWLPFLINAYFRPSTVVGQPLKNIYLNKVVKKFRSMWGTTVLPKKGALKGLMKALRNGEIIGLVVDQAVKPEEGIEVRLFNKRTLFTSVMVTLAKRYNTPILPIFCIRERPGLFKIAVYSPILVKNEADTRMILQRVVNTIEDIILRYPEQWFWVHKRWKKTYPYLYIEDLLRKKRKKRKKNAYQNAPESKSGDK